MCKTKRMVKKVCDEMGITITKEGMSSDKKYLIYFEHNNKTMRCGFSFTPSRPYNDKLVRGFITKVMRYQGISYESRRDHDSGMRAEMQWMGKTAEQLAFESHNAKRLTA